jgi:hypothetical protein
MAEQPFGASAAGRPAHLFASPRPGRKLSALVELLQPAAVPSGTIPKRGRQLQAAHVIGSCGKEAIAQKEPYPTTGHRQADCHISNAP